MIDQLKPLLGKLALFSQERLGFKHPPKLFLRNDSQNSQQVLGKTAFYNPEEQSVTLFVHGRHPKDILRSFTHELVHHCQNERGDLSPDKMTAQGPGYAQECPHMRKMEQEAYLEGSMCFRDWEDTIEDKDLILIKLAESKFLKENKQMTTKITKEFLKETIRKVVQQVLKEGPQVMTKENPKYKEAKQMIAAIAAARNDAADKKASLELFAADMLKNQPVQSQAFNDALNIVNMVENPKNLAFSDDDQINRHANAYYTGLLNGTSSQQNLTKKRDDLLKYAQEKGVTGDLSSGLDATAAQGDGLLQAKEAAGIHAAISTFTRAGDKVTRAPVVRTKAAAPATSPTQPSIDGAIASAEPTIGMGGGTIPTPSVEPKPQKPVAGGGATSGKQDVLMKKAQQVRILKRNALPGLAGINNIRQLQQRLVDAGYASDTLPNGKPFVDGDYGGASQRAMADLQREIGANPDGVIGTNTYKRLLGYTPKNPKSKAAVFFKGKSLMDLPDMNKPIPTLKQIGAGAPDEVPMSNLTRENNELDESNCGSGKRKDGEPCGNRKCKTCYPMEEGKLPDGLQKYQDEQAEKKTDDSESENECSSCGGKKPDGGCPHCDGDAPRNQCKCGHDDKGSEKSGDSKDGKMPMKQEPPGKDLNNDGKKGSGEVPAFLKEGSKVQTPEQENTLYEQRFAPKNNRLFEKLVKEWTK